MISKKKIFISGGAGFIATHLVERLVSDNQIIIYDSFSRNALKESNHLSHPNLKIVQGDILDFNRLKTSIPQDADIILHMAAIAGIDTVIKNPMKTMEVNIVGTYNLLKALTDLMMIDKVKCFVNFSTSEVFGINTFRADEGSSVNLQPVGEARWTYSVSKLTGEHMVYSYYQQLGLRAVSVRPFNVYGPMQIGEGAIHHFVIRAIRNEPLVIHGEGDQIRSWCYIDDMVEGILLCLEEEKAIGEVLNIGNPKGTITILGLAEKVIQIAKSSSEICHSPKNYVDVELRIPSIKKIKELIGFEPKVDLNEGIRRTIEWYATRAGRT
jgi:dTDP-glucose 4,6-dehydratase